MGDLNAKLGTKKDDEVYVGYNGVGTRNHRGEMLANFLVSHKLYAMNTFFQKKAQRKWTWKSPDGHTRNEIDFIISNSKEMVKDVTVLNKFSTGSDHRLVRAKLHIPTKLERSKLIRPKTSKYNMQLLEQNKIIYQVELDNNLSRILATPNLSTDAHFQGLAESIKLAAEKTVGKVKNNKTSKISENTKALMNERRQLLTDETRNNEKIRTLNKEIRRCVRKDINKYNENLVETIIEQNKGTKIFQQRSSTGSIEICKLMDEQGNMLSNREEILCRIERFYRELYSSKVDKTPYHNKSDKRAKLTKHYTEDLPEISRYEIKNAMRHMKNNKTPGEDDIVIELIKEGSPDLLLHLEKLFNQCLENGETPNCWKNSMVKILPKNGNKHDIENYRPISLLSHVYKLFTKVITNRISNRLDQFQPVEQAGFR